jgi:SagB-type dehydrogenase family enzyme
MPEAEWQTYLALEQAGPRSSPYSGIIPALPPWGNGEVENGSLLQTEDTLISPLHALLSKRRSASHLWHPLSKHALSQLLRLSLSRPTQGPPFRPYPTSGGCDELGILIAARNVEGLSEGAYWASIKETGSLAFAAPLDEHYAAFERRMCPFLGHTPAYPPAALLLILADWRRLAARYENCLLASALWDAGALLQTLHLAATATKVNACICACIQPRLVETWLHLDCQQVGQVGLLALGGRFEESPPFSARSS